MNKIFYILILVLMFAPEIAAGAGIELSKTELNVTAGNRTEILIVNKLDTQITILNVTSDQRVWFWNDSSYESSKVYLNKLLASGNSTPVTLKIEEQFSGMLLVDFNITYRLDNQTNTITIPVTFIVTKEQRQIPSPIIQDYNISLLKKPASVNLSEQFEVTLLISNTTGVTILDIISESPRVVEVDNFSVTVIRGITYLHGENFTIRLIPTAKEPKNYDNITLKIASNLPEKKVQFSLEVVKPTVMTPTTTTHAPTTTSLPPPTPPAATPPEPGIIDTLTIIAIIFAILLGVVISYIAIRMVKTGEFPSVPFGKKKITGREDAGYLPYEYPPFPAMHHVRIEVLDEKGNPINNSIIYLDRNSTKSGPYTSFYVAKGTHILSVSSEGYNSVTKVLEVNRDVTETIRLTRVVGTLKVTVTTPSGKALSNAVVKINEMQFTTDSDGNVTSPLPPGVYDVSAAKQIYSTKSEKVEVLPNQTKSLSLVLSPSVVLSGSHNTRLHQALQSIYNSYNEISGKSYNQTIPKYFRRIGETIVHSLKQEAEKIENFSSQAEFNQEMEEYVKATETAFSIIAQGMIERRNLNLYDKANSLPSEEPPSISPAIVKNVDTVKMKLADLDNRITRETGSITIYPVTILWKAAQQILNSSTEPSAVIANIIIDATRTMLDSPTLRKYLEV